MRRTVLREEGVVRMSLLDRERTVAPRGYNRWLIPPAALAVHLSIGEIYAFSVFKVPLKDHFGTGLTPIGIIFSIAIGMLGLSAAFGGRWVERAGPRKAMTLAAVCWGSGFLIGALGVATTQLWLVYLGVGFIGGIGLGIGYISPVSTLIKWFPDRPGMATGLAIMGFGGGALIASPLEAKLLSTFATKPEDAIVGSFVVLGVVYFIAMMLGAMAVKVPADGWKPEGWTAPSRQRALISTGNVTATNAIKTPQFWLLWTDLFGTIEVGAIHGRLLTAWSAAGIVGPLIVNGLADHETSVGKSGSDLYTISLFIMVGVLVVGFLANLAIKPVDERFHEAERAAAAERDARFARDGEPATVSPTPSTMTTMRSRS